MIKAEYTKVSDLFLPYPKGFDGYTSLAPFFKKLIGIVPDDIRQFIIVNNQNAADEIKNCYPAKNIQPLVIENFHEIWLRDIMGFNTGMNKIYQPIFRPDYCPYIYTGYYLDRINYSVSEIFEKSIGAELIKMPIILDGGNFVSNGKIAFVTDKIIKDNYGISKEPVKRLSNYLGVEVLVIPSNKYDVLAHADGYLNFLNEDTICVAQYLDTNIFWQDRIYIRQLEYIAKKHSLNVVPIIDNPVAEKVIGGGKTFNDTSDTCLDSAQGIHTNFLILNDTIIFPEYSNDEKAHSDINKHMLQRYRYNVESIDCDKLSKFGGVLHCVSFTN